VTKMADLVPACVWRVTPELLFALDARFGEPVDSYVNGSQVWLRDDGPGEATLEWRLHPIAGYQKPRGVATHELLEMVIFALRSGDEPPAPLDQLWDGLEAFPGFGDETEPALLAQACTTALGIAPDVFGVVDHQRIGDQWEASNGKTSVIAALFEQLQA
jgi:hypothetical protein